MTPRFHRVRQWKLHRTNGQHPRKLFVAAISLPRIRELFDRHSQQIRLPGDRLTIPLLQTFTIAGFRGDLLIVDFEQCVVRWYQVVLARSCLHLFQLEQNGCVVFEKREVLCKNAETVARRDAPHPTFGHLLRLRGEKRLLRALFATGRDA